MKILWLRPTKPDNISVGRGRIADRLRHRGHHVFIQDASGLDAFKAVKVAASGDFDVIVGTVRMGLYVGFLISMVLRMPLIADVTDPIEQIADLPWPLFWLLGKYENFVLSRADASLFVYESSFESATARGIDGVKVMNGVDFNRFNAPNAEVVDRARSELRAAGIDPQSRIAVYIGGLEPVYHIEDILNAAEHVTNVEFVFIGDGQLRDLVESTADHEENIHFLGSFEYELIPGFLAHSDVGLCLVDAEQPLKVLEYGAAELPVIAIPGELQDRFAEDELIFVESVEDLAHEVSSLVDDSNVRQAYGTRLRSQAESADWEEIADIYEQTIEDVTLD